MIAWRPRNDPPEVPLELIAHEDFVAELEFSGQVNSFPTGTTITLVIYADSDPAAPTVTSWPATVNLGASKAEWSVDHKVADKVNAPAFYRLWLTMPNEAVPANPVLDRCLALGDLTRK